MKVAAMLLAAGLSGLTSAFGLGVDIDGFGRTLSQDGWKKNRTAVYTIDNQTYRTHVPTVTRNLDGGIFVSARVDHVPAMRPDAVSYIELTFTPEGYVGSAQIRVKLGGTTLNTGQVLREEAPIPVDAEIGSPDWRSVHMKLVLELFRKLDTEFEKFEESDGESGAKRDLWGRLNGSSLDTANLSASLRHNLNMLLSNVGHDYGVLGVK